MAGVSSWRGDSMISSLAPREVIKGETSYGMLLAAHDAQSGKVVIMGPTEPVSPGSKVS